MRLSVVFKEVLADTKQFVALHANAKFFVKLSDDGLRCFFSSFDSSSGKRPKGVAFELVEQEMPMFKRYGGSTEMKAVRVDAEAGGFKVEVRHRG